MPNTVLLKGNPFRKEGVAVAAGILPGDLLEQKNVAYNAAGVGTFGVHSLAAPTYKPQPIFALENEVYSGVGTLSKLVSDAYAISDTLMMGWFRPGEEVWAWLKNDANANVVIGDKLMSTGDGKLTKLTGATAVPVAIALETLNNTAGGVPVRIKAEVL